MTTNTQRVGKIWKIYNRDDKNDYVLHASFTQQERDMMRKWRIANAGLLSWVENSDKEIVEDSVSCDSLRSLRIRAKEKEITMRGNSISRGGSGDDPIPEDIKVAMLNMKDHNGDPMKDNTIRTYQYSIRKLLRTLCAGQWDRLIFFDMDKLAQYVKDSNVSQHRQIVGAIRMIRTIIDTQDRLAIDAMNRYAHQKQAIAKAESLAQKALELDLSDDEDGGDNKLGMEELKAKRDAIDDKRSYDYLVASFYTIMPPKRPSTLVKIGFDKSNRNMNYLDDSGVLHLRHTKNIGSTGMKKQQISDDMLKIIRDFKDYFESIGIESKWLFAKKLSGGRYTHINANVLCKDIERIFGCGNNRIRHQYVTEATSRGDDMDKVAELMDTSIVCTTLTYDDKRGERVKELKKIKRSERLNKTHRALI